MHFLNLGAEELSSEASGSAQKLAMLRIQQSIDSDILKNDAAESALALMSALANSENSKATSAPDSKDARLKKKQAAKSAGNTNQVLTTLG